MEAYLCFVLFEVGHHDLGLIVDGEDDLGDAGLGEGFDLVANDWLVAEVNAGLGEGERHGPKPGAESADENKRFH